MRRISILFLFITLSIYSQNSIDVYEKYNVDRYIYSESNDCSVIAYAEAFNVSYFRATEALRPYRDKGEPIFLYDLMKALVDKDPCITMIEGDEATTLRMILDVLPYGSYLVGIPKHVFFFEQNIIYTIHDSLEYLDAPILILFRIK